MMERDKTAAAIKYEKGRDRAPRVVAKGRGKMAERILAVARACDVPVQQDQDLARVLDALDLNTEIPPELYLAIAEVLVFIYELDRSAEPRQAPATD